MYIDHIFPPLVLPKSTLTAGSLPSSSPACVYHILECGTCPGVCLTYGAIPLKKTWSSSPSSYQIPMAPDPELGLNT